MDYLGLYKPTSREAIEVKRDETCLVTLALVLVYGSPVWTLDRRELYWEGKELISREAAWKRLRRRGWKVKGGRFVTTGARSRKTLDAETREAMKKVTYQVEHNPNCPSPYLVRRPGYLHSVIFGDDRDAKGYGLSVEEAFREAVAVSESQKAAAKERRAAA